MSDQRTAAPGTVVASRPHRVLFLDDEAAILASLRSLFRRERYELEFFTEPEEALSRLRSSPVDMIVSDMRMPAMSGADFLAQATTIQPYAIRIMLSGYEDKGVVISAIGKGLAKDYVMKPWDDTSFRQMVADNLQMHRALHDTELRRILGQIDSLTAPARSVETITRVLGGADVNIKDIVVAVEQSPPLVARLLRVANSVHYSTRHPIGTVKDAVLFVGTEFVASLLLAMETFDALQEDCSPEGRKCMDRLWDEALRRATIAKAIAARWDGSQQQHVAYVASLFQDIGLVLRAQLDPHLLAAFFHAVDGEDVPLLQADARVFTITHDEVGSSLLRFWNFPEEIVRAVECHHRVGVEDPLARILKIAEDIERAVRTGKAIDGQNTAAAEWYDTLSDTLAAFARAGAADSEDLT